MEKDQELAYELEQINNENLAEQQRKDICRKAEAACLETIRSHLITFLEQHQYESADIRKEPLSYEMWIRELHPENALGEDIDHRFYVEDSDHLRLWNEYNEASSVVDKVGNSRSETADGGLVRVPMCNNRRGNGIPGQ